MTRHWPGFWADNGVLARLLGPVEWLFRCIASSRRRRLEPIARAMPAPVVVVGNLAVGGSGKTPLVIWLVAAAAARGWRPGVVLRGYGGRARGITAVTGDSDPAAVGDEAVLIAKRTGYPVMTGRDRAAAADALVATGDVDLVISDDGLQHYRLARDVEIVVVDARRGHGNARCLPAGPLREPPSRLAEVDAVIGHGGAVDENGYRFMLIPGDLRPVTDSAPAAPASGDRVHAVAGIGHPERFFDVLRAMGLEVVAHPLGDHHRYRAGDLRFGDDAAVVMTEKDAVKCRAIAPQASWYLPVAAQPDHPSARCLEGLLDRAQQRFNNRKGTS
ncbi:tetraacyldisaccharide 4'-kinase [Spiribacter vilamensis]|uniref:Tetraacyldisaccharide 4'-kinase n=1 Tax=Spiribacter vilamensis TaxID=531306 RepID=A0A4Q8CZQ0_9GAMM|nr:tetraacyldisaccharide 4'-kinase [Spiribacter vilamensis]RZU98516.1 lipid-A-disaccharide kinase [Spiribacter vilamensis]TVO60620.1 tetraacyldisaccharide 4'-kinase [Spiribacter vilamensis]